MPQTLLSFANEETMISAMEAVGAHHVSYQISGYYEAYGPPQNRVLPGIATIFKDLSGYYYVSAEQDVLNLLQAGVSLNDHVDADPEAWQCYHCAVETSNGTAVELYLTLKDCDKMSKTLDKEKPYKYKDDDGDKMYIFGAQAVIPYNCSKLSRNAVMQLTTWYGDEIT